MESKAAAGERTEANGAYRTEIPHENGAFAGKFRIMLEMIPHPDGGKWSGTKMERATNGKIKTSYFSSLRDGHIDIPRVDKIEAIASTMGFLPQLWFKKLGWWENLRARGAAGDDVGTALGGSVEGTDGGRFDKLLQRLFEVRLNPETGEIFTLSEVAAKSGGVLDENDVRALLTGRLLSPTWGQVLALCEVFEIDPSYFSQRKNPWPSRSAMRLVEDEDSYSIFQTSLKLSEDSRAVLRALSEHLLHIEEK